jgi:hypothetical protein
MDLCDVNMDGNIVYAEMFNCLIDAENSWRRDNCDHWSLIDDCYIPIDWCEGALSCPDVIDEVNAYMAAHDSNGDGAITN